VQRSVTATQQVWQQVVDAAAPHKGLWGATTMISIYTRDASAG
jgi:hypothetical protein